MKGDLTRRDALGRLTCLAGFSGVDLCGQTSAETPARDPLKTLRSGHPRLLLPDSDLERIRQSVRDSALARRVYGDLEKEADRLLSTPPVEYRFGGPGTRTTPRRVIDRVLTLALMYRLTGKDPWLRRAIMELKSAANFRDWNPNRFVDCAEMAFAFAVGYDWLYNSLSAPERKLVREALLNKGLDPARPAFQMKNWWTRDRTHWNIVCSAAVAISALAVAETGDDPDADHGVADQAAEFLKAAVESIPHGLSAWGTDGSWPEGPVYGEFAARYASLFLASLDTALGNDLGFGIPRGLDRFGRFRVHTSSPANGGLSFGDGPVDPGQAPEMFWLSRRLNAPVWAWQEQRQVERATRPDPLDVMWFVRDVRSPQQPPVVPLDAVFGGIALATFRSSWEDPNALFLAVKGGDNKLSQAHYDLGAFVLDAGGVRWALDAGPDDPGATTASRASRARTEAHSTLLIDGESQDSRAEARFVRQELARQEGGVDFSWVQLDLSKASSRIRQWTRKAGIVQRQGVLIEDLVSADQPIEVVWGMITDADVTVNGPTAVLKKGGWNLLAEIRTPRHAIFDVAQIRPSGNSAAVNLGRGGKTQRLVIRLLEKTSELNLGVVLTPYKDGQNKPKLQWPAPL